MTYELEEVYEYILDLADKKGSDFFQLPFVRSVFITQTINFIGGHIKKLEATQQVKEDIRPLMVTTKENVIGNPDNPFTVLCIIPENCHYLSLARPLFKGGVVPRITQLIRHAREETMVASPHNRPTISYPIVTEYLDVAEINSGINEKAIGCYLTYIKKPIYANLDEPSKRIVDLPDAVIEDIVQKTVFELESGKGDERSQVSYQKSETFRK